MCVCLNLDFGNSTTALYHDPSANDVIAVHKIIFSINAAWCPVGPLIHGRASLDLNVSKFTRYILQIRYSCKSNLSNTNMDKQTYGPTELSVEIMMWM